MPGHDSRRTIDLLKGYPNPSLLPAQAISDAARAILADSVVSTPALLYGADEGYLPFRQAVADWNTSFYGRKVTTDNIVISGGASQNLACVLQVFSDPLYTQNVWIVSPAYMLVFRIFQDHGFADKMKAVPEIKDGLDIEWLQKELEQCEHHLSQDPTSSKTLKPSRPYSKYYRHILYCVPTFSNPSSTITSLPRRQALVRLARQHDMLLISDDVYDHLQWPSRPAPSLAPLTRALLPRLIDIDADLDGGFLRPGADGFGNALSNGSFSKIVGPGVRCGWTDAAPKLAFGVSQAGSSRSGGCPSQLMSTFIMQLITSGWLRGHIAGLQREYARRYHILRDALEREVVPLGGRFEEPGEIMGGYFIWIRLPDGVDGDVLSERCKEEDVVVISGSLFEVPVEGRLKHGDHIRLCFAFEEVEVLEEGARRVGRALQGCLP
ncbi:hypothetical protein KVT40_002102 [Elsinoe batatas]|uniref:Aminotransferase class I/classII large domain-containing protein n=1 Tax=Elsinoe batatas TaxID=2601811 RepID=A0A8K0L9B1_9PEZI|nr:hypothetical protein KVT40_002102 [Elsinoe batatas]